MNQPDQSSQPMVALAKANERRAAIATLARNLRTLDYRTGCQHLAAILRYPPDNLDGVRILRLLTMPCEVGDTTAYRLLDQAGINPDRRLRQLTIRQRHLLANAVENSYRIPGMPAAPRSSRKAA